MNIIKDFIQCRPVDDVEIRSAVQHLADENQRLKEALHPNSYNRTRLAGKIDETIFLDAVCECGETVNFNRVRKVPWHVIQDVLKLLQKVTKIKE